MRKKKTIKELRLIANSVRKSIIQMIFEAKSGHPAGALGMADILTYLYFYELKHNPKNPFWKERDFFILSNGHTCPVLYGVLAESGYFRKKELLTLRKLGTRLQGHPHNISLPGVENSGGPLGQGISQAVGLAASLKRENKRNRVFCFVGDGELEEGECYEAMLFANKEKLNNLRIIVDYNHIQIDGDPDCVLKLGSLQKKFSAFGFATIEFRGNDFKEIIAAFKYSNKMKSKSVCLIAKNIPGRGVSFMENKVQWHGRAPNEYEAKKALEELEEERLSIENE